MKRKTLIFISIFIFAIGFILVVLGKERILSDVEPFSIPNSIENISITSPSNYTEDENFLYFLTEEETEEFKNILFTQKVKRSLFSNEFSPEYFLLFEINNKEHIIKVNDKKIHVESSNDYYNLESEELFLFISTLNN